MRPSPVFLVRVALILIGLALYPASALSQTFEEICKEINPVTNKYRTSNGVEWCYLKGASGTQYGLEDLVELNTSCVAKGQGRYATIGNNHYADESTPKGEWENRLIVTCWYFAR